MSDRHHGREDWREKLGREFNRPAPEPSSGREPPRPSGGPGRGGPREMFDAVCASCGKATQVPFQPRGDRPVYCSDCHRARQGGAQGAQSRPRESVLAGRKPRNNAAQDATFSLDAYLDELKRGYFDESGNIRQTLIVDDARGVAATLAAGRPQLSAGALRRFYDLAKAQERRLRMGVSFAVVNSSIDKMRPHAFDAFKKGKIPSEFLQFIEGNVEQAVRTERTFRDGFLQHFECVVAYFPRTR